MLLLQKGWTLLLGPLASLRKKCISMSFKYAITYHFAISIYVDILLYDNILLYELTIRLKIIGRGKLVVH